MSARAVSPNQGPGVLSAFLWKEMQEARRWGPVALALMIAGLLVGSVFGDFPMATEFEGVPRLTGGLFTLLCALVGGVIAFAQFMPERAGDRWAFAVHRPASRTALFVARAVTGAGCYLIATGIPFIFIIWWAATPGHRAAPFDMRLAIPGAVDLVTGPVYYFAVAFAVMYRPRWAVMRGVAVIAAMLVSTAVETNTSLAGALVCCAIGLVLIVTAAWATFVAGGAYEQQPLAGRAATGTMLGLGIGVCGLLVTVLLSIVRSDPMGPTRSLAYRITNEGVIVRTEAHDRIIEVTSLDGRPLGTFTRESPPRMLDSGVTTSGMVTLNPEGMYSLVPGYRSPSRLFERMQTAADDLPGTVWFFVRQSGLIAGYDVRARRLLGWIGPDGFTAGDTPPASRFTGALRSTESSVRTSPLLTLSDAVYRVDLDRRTIDLVFRAPAGDTIVGAARSGVDQYASMLTIVMSTTTERQPAAAPPVGAMPSTDTARFEVVATTRSVYVLSGDRTPPFVVPHDPGASGYGSLSVMRLVHGGRKRIALWYTADLGTRPEGQWASLPQQVTTFGADGTVIAHQSLPRFEGHPGIALTSTSGIALFTRAITPPALVVELHRTGDTGFPLAAGERSALLMALLNASLVGLLTFWRGRAYAVPPRRLWTWVVLGAVLGPLAFVVMLMVVEWPAREPCPTCGRQRVAIREHCEHCGKPFSPPAADGTEILEALPA